MYGSMIDRSGGRIHGTRVPICMGALCRDSPGHCTSPSGTFVPQGAPPVCWIKQLREFRALCIAAEWNCVFSTQFRCRKPKAMSQHPHSGWLHEAPRSGARREPSPGDTARARFARVGVALRRMGRVPDFPAAGLVLIYFAGAGTRAEGPSVDRARIPEGSDRWPTAAKTGFVRLIAI